MSRRLDELLARAQESAQGIPELLTGVELLEAGAIADPEMALIRTRKLLEFVVHDWYERSFQENPGSRPLENLIQRLIKEQKLPKKLAASANLIRELGNVGAHGFGEGVGVGDVEGAVGHLVPLLEWYRSGLCRSRKVFRQETRPRIL
jgi:hypothetical protein